MGYRFLRGLLRIWFALFFRTVRVLRAERLAASGPALLAVSHPPSLLDALIILAAMERPVHCLVPKSLLRGFFWRSIVGALGMIPYELEGEAWQSAIDTCCGLLSRGEAIAIFADAKRVRPPQAGRPGLAVATLALRAESRQSGKLGLIVFPVHLLLPVASSQSSGLLIYVDPPLRPRDYLLREGGIRPLAGAIEEAWRENAFRLPASEVNEFLSDLEDVLRADLEEDWALRPAWRQTVDGFQLSGFVAGWAEQMNYLNPGKLVAIREVLEDYHERRRRWWLRQFEVETGAAWMQSRLHRSWVWFESAFGLPIAAYGLINHLLAWLLLFWSGVLREEKGRDSWDRWLLGVLLVVGSYAGQIILCAHFLSRKAAGYYAPSLPFAGAYLWRYLWLVRHRTRIGILALCNPREGEELRRKRKELIREVNRASNTYAETLGVVH